MNTHDTKNLAQFFSSACMCVHVLLHEYHQRHLIRFGNEHDDANQKKKILIKYWVRARQMHNQISNIQRRDYVGDGCVWHISIIVDVNIVMSCRVGDN